MTWINVEPKIAKPKPYIAPVFVSTNPPGNRGGHRLIVTVRVEKIEGGLPFWQNKARVRVQIGTDEHHGMLRITPGGDHCLGSMGGKATSVSLQIPVPLGVDCGQMGKTAVEFDHNETFLEIMLPEWARSKPGARVLPHAEPRAHGIQVFRTAATNGAAPKTVTGGL